MAKRSSDTLNVYIGAARIQRLQELASQQERSLSWLVRKAIDDLLAKADKLNPRPAPDQPS